MRDPARTAAEEEIDALARYVMRRHARAAEAAARRRAAMFGALDEPQDAARWWRVAGRIGELGRGTVIPFPGRGPG